MERGGEEEEGQRGNEMYERRKKISLLVSVKMYFWNDVQFTQAEKLEMVCLLNTK